MSRHAANDACLHVAGSVATVAFAVGAAVQAAAQAAAAERARQAAYERACAAQRAKDARLITAVDRMRAYAVLGAQLLGHA